MIRMARHQFIGSSVALAVMLSAGLVSAAESRPGSQDVPSLLQEAKDAARAIADDPYLRDTALRGIAGAQAEEGRFDAALDTAALIADENLRTGAWRQIAVARARAGDREAAGKLLDKVLKEVASFKNVPPSRVKALIATAEAQAQIGDVPGAIETAGAIAEEKIKAQALRGIAVARAEKGDRDGALQTAAGIRDPYLKAGALRRIAVAPPILKDRAAALDILKQALDSAGAIQGENEKADALGGITMAFLAAGDVKGAFRTVALIESAFVGKPLPEVAATTRSEVLRAIAVAQAQAGDSPRALQTTENIATPYMQASALAEIAVAQAERGDRIAAEATLRRALQVSSAIREFAAKAPALLGIAQAYAKVGDRAAATRTFRQARQAVRVSDDERYKTDALIDLAMVQSGAGDFSGAVETADGIRDVHARAHAWRIVAAAQGENREPVLSWVAKDGAPARKAYALLGLAEGLLQTKR
ncbi:MAG: hypothetical protein HY284_07925 [Nitrospirae bacterium]|nr:hypothetical protein [Nitrospirota bacterium]